MVGGPEAMLIIDDTALLKLGTRSVGVARQYAGAAGKTTNCRTLVSLTLARDEVPVGLALRLYLPRIRRAAWRSACRRTGSRIGRSWRSRSRNSTASPRRA